MTAVDIVNCKAGLTQSTVTAVLRKLLREEFVEVVGVTHSGKVLSRTYRPTPASQEHLLKDVMDSYGPFIPVLGRIQMCAAILCAGDYDSEEVHEIIRKLEEEFK